MDGVLDRLKDAVYALTGACCSAGGSTLKLNGRQFKIVKLLGEGGFSYVYLAQDVQSGRLFALKKIRCPLGSDSVREALKEVEAYRKFRHRNIIRCLDSCVIQDPEEGTKVIYLFLPYYERATVQHAINAHAVNGTHFAESELLKLFLGTCQAVRAMHEYTSGPSVDYPPAPTTNTTASDADRRDSIEDDDDEDDKVITRGEGEGERLIGSLEANLSTVAHEPTGTPAPAGMGDPDGGVVLGRLQASSERQEGSSTSAGSLTPWAHRDIKPANVMIADDGQAVLMDFGSAMPARVKITRRQVALQQQDLAAEHSSMPYRAPELFDVKTDTTLTEAVDIWSLGCTLFAMAYGHSPFETSQQSEYGSSVAMAVLSGRYTIPKNDRMSEGFKRIVEGCLQVDPDKRWTIGQVIDETEQVLARLS